MSFGSCWQVYSRDKYSYDNTRSISDNKVCTCLWHEIVTNRGVLYHVQDAVKSNTVIKTLKTAVD